MRSCDFVFSPVAGTRGTIATIAAVAAALNQRGLAFPSEALDVCARLLNDPNPLVRKAVAWAIREVALVDTEAARKFVHEHTNAMHPTVRKQTGLDSI